MALMFTKPDKGAIWRNDWNRYVWHPALKGAGVVPCRQNGFHQFRHYYAPVSPMGSTSAPSPNTSATTTRVSLSVPTRTCSPRVPHGRAGPSTRPSPKPRIAPGLPKTVRRGRDLRCYHFTKI